MNNKKVLEKLLNAYRSSFDITHPFTIPGKTYDAYAAFRVTSSKYVLSKKAELWRAQCFEHVFFERSDDMSSELLDDFKNRILEYIEPSMVRHGEPCPPKDHMYTYITGVFLIENGVSPELVRQIRKFRFSKNYRFTIRGYCDARVVVIDVQNRTFYGNPAARDLLKGYKKMKHLFD